MNDENKLHFRVSTGLKNIIGRELINDKFIAIFELVKNSYDAGAKKVVIKFDDIYGKAPSIIISDDGCGMSKNDLIDKWLFVAYSAKRHISYRDNIKKRIYAGAKGVGRFSCDRLGSILNIISKTVDDNLVNRLTVNWDDFEKNDEEDFVDINVIYDVITNHELIETNGTIVVIKNLRERWDRIDLLSLKSSLTKLINPSSTNQYDDFQVFIEAPDEIKNDYSKELEREKVNGQVKNYIFETLGIKTTQINVMISKDGKTIKTVLYDRGTYLFDLEEKNPYTLKDIICTLYHLNRAAKINFTKLMGIEPVNYGTVFVYKNGFRIYPYGEPGEDFFSIDKRKAQGYNRFLGTREIVGRLQIYGQNDGLTETSSRNGGFIKTHQYDELITFFSEFVLKPLEKYVVNIIRWAEPYLIENNLHSPVQPNQLDDLTVVVKKIKPSLRDSNILKIGYNEDLIRVIEENKMPTIDKTVEELKKFAITKNDENLFITTKKIEEQTKNLQKRVFEDSKNTQKMEKMLDVAKEELQTTKKQVEILEERANLTIDDTISAMHIIKSYADAADSNVEEAISEIQNQEFDINEIQDRLLDIRQNCHKIINSYNLIMHTDFKVNTDVDFNNIVAFIDTYITKEYSSRRIKKLDIIINDESLNNMKIKFNPLEFSMVIDNIISNSIKANAFKLYINIKSVLQDTIEISFKDNGAGLDESISDPDRIFESGYTKTGGTGVGLATAKKYIEKINGTINVNTNNKDGFELIVRLRI